MTAVKWFFIELTNRGLPPHKEIIKCFEQAKEMEHKQIVDAVTHGNRQEVYDATETIGQNYYNETYTNVQQP
jgi:DNA-binding FadR family transcriptional regulator